MAMMTSAVTALAGMGLSAYQIIDGQKKKKKAQAAAQSAMNKLASTKEENMTKGLKSPDISSLAFESNQRAVNQATQAAMEMGPAGAAAMTGIVEGARESNLQTAQAQAQMNYDRDKFVASQEQGVEARNVGAERDILTAEVMGAQNAVSDATNQTMAGVSGLVGSATAGIDAVGNALVDKEIINLYKGSKAAQENGMSQDQYAEAFNVAGKNGYSPEDFEKGLFGLDKGLFQKGNINWDAIFKRY